MEENWRALNNSNWRNRDINGNGKVQIDCNYVLCLVRISCVLVLLAFVIQKSYSVKDIEFIEFRRSVKCFVI